MVRLPLHGTQSSVHVNRTLQQLRAEGLILTQGNGVRVLDWDRLHEAGEFAPDYLFLGSGSKHGGGQPLAGQLGL